MYNALQSQELLKRKMIDEQFILHKDFFVLNRGEYQDSLNRIKSFIFLETDYFYIDFVSNKTLEDYIRYHKSLDFKIVTFQQALSDVKTFTHFMMYFSKRKKVIHMDLSIQNFGFWMKL